MEELERLKLLFVLVPIDRAANTIGFICDKYFLEILQAETRSPTYEPCEKSVMEMTEHIAEYNREIGITNGKENKDLPQIHATIKMHKNTTKFRFIFGARYRLRTKTICKTTTSQYF